MTGWMNGAMGEILDVKIGDRRRQSESGCIYAADKL